MSWICPVCENSLGDLNAYCEYCKQGNQTVYNPDKYYIREIRVNHLADGDKTVTPQEELFKELFNHEKLLVKDMTILELRAHREELAKIAFEARARLSAADDEDNQRKPKSNEPKGFKTSINADEHTKGLINTIKERTERVSKREKLILGLIKLGYSRADAEKKMEAGTVLSQLRIKEAQEKIDKQKEADFRPIFNPFLKKEEKKEL